MEKETEKSSFLPTRRRTPGTKDASPEATDGEKQTRTLRDTALGILALVLMGLFAAVSSASVQMLEGTIPDLQLNSVRSVVPLFLTLLVIISERRLPNMPEQGFLHIIGNGLLGTVVSITVYISVTYLPLGTVQALMMTASLASGIVLCRLLLKEKFSLLKVAAVTLAILGIFLIIQPEFIFKSLKQGDKNLKSENMLNHTKTKMADNEESNLVNILIFGGLFAALCGVAYSAQSVVVKLAEKHMNVVEYMWDISFWGFLIQVWISILLMYFLESFKWPETIAGNVLIFLHATSYFVTRQCIIFSLPKLEGHTSVLISNTSIILFMVLAQYTVSQDIHPGHRNWIEIVGIILVLFASILQSLVELVRK